VYDSDPMQNPNARRFEHLTYMQALNMQIKVMDATAITTCMDNDLPIQVVNLWDKDALVKLVMGEPIGTLIGH
jgi:uridylate kinase